MFVCVFVFDVFVHSGVHAFFCSSLRTFVRSCVRVFVCLCTYCERASVSVNMHCV